MTLSVLLALFPVFYDFGGVAGDDGIVGDRFDDDGACADDSPLAYRDILGEDGNARANPYVVADCEAREPNAALVDHRARQVVEMMSSAENHQVGTNHHITTNREVYAMNPEMRTEA